MTVTVESQKRNEEEWPKSFRMEFADQDSEGFCFRGRSDNSDLTLLFPLGVLKHHFMLN